MKRLLLLALCACGAAQTAPEAAPLHVHDYFPMEEGGVWSYDIDTGFGPPVFGVLRVEAIDGERIDIRNNGGELSRFERRPEGIFDLIQGVWYLRAPLEIGTEWAGAGGRTVRFVAVGEQVEVPAGTFDGCVVTEGTGGEDGRTIRTSYCPSVGMTLQEASMEMRMSGERAAVTSRLRG
ncbi:MAG: hypothetical protein AAF645_24760, partial [Myxococcota bacterium]